MQSYDTLAAKVSPKNEGKMSLSFWVPANTKFLKTNPGSKKGPLLPNTALEASNPVGHGLRPVQICDTVDAGVDSRGNRCLFNFDILP